jgi:hypothetical protein
MPYQIAPNFAACNAAVPGAGGQVLFMNTINNTSGNIFQAGVGTQGGAICIFDFTTLTWVSLTQSAMAMGYPIGGEINGLQFLNFNNNRYMYFANLAGGSAPTGLWRATLDGNNQVGALVNLFNTSIYSNVPDSSTLLLSTLFIDPFNNVYIGSGVIETKQSGKQRNKNIMATTTPTKAYVLLAGSTTWQAITLANDDTAPAITLSLAVDGKTPVVGTYNTTTKVTRAYYLSGVNN